MLLKYLLKKFIKIGTLTVIDANNKIYTFVGTPKPSVKIRFKNKSIEWKLLYNPDIAVGEGYMNGDIVIEQGNLREFLELCYQNYELQSLESLNHILKIVLFPFLEFNNILNAKKNVAKHYDLKTELFELFLGKDLIYSCAYFNNPNEDLETAQLNKMRHLAAKLRLKPNQKVLDIGCGWGGLSLYLAKYANVEVVGITLSEEQFKIANERAKQVGLDHKVKFYLRDYREEKDKYDRIVSVGMLEHVGLLHYDHFFNQVKSLLNESGLAIIHSICRYRRKVDNKNWINKYIFPGGYVPALSEVVQEIEKKSLYITDIEILRDHYVYTLRSWFERFTAHHEQIKALYDEKFYRLWESYLIGSELAFSRLGEHVFQIQIQKSPIEFELTCNYIIENEKKLRALGG